MRSFLTNLVKFIIKGLMLLFLIYVLVYTISYAWHFARFIVSGHFNII